LCLASVLINVFFVVVISATLTIAKCSA